MNKFVKSFKRIYFIYLLSILAAFLLSFYTIDLITTPKDGETFGILIEGNEVSLKEENLCLSNNIKSVDINNVESNTIGIFIYAQKESSDYDLLIMSDDMFNDNDYTYSLLEVNESSLNENLPNHEKDYVYKNNKIYGFNITKSLNKVLEKELTKKYYVCFFLNSLHSGGLGNNDSSESLNVLKNLLN